MPAAAATSSHFTIRRNLERRGPGEGRERFDAIGGTPD